MGQSKRGKLNQLLAEWPHATISVCSWLHQQGFGYDLINKYRRGKWLVPVGRGAVARAGDRVHWTGGLYAIQEQLGLAIHAGGKTALQMHGYAHFLPLAEGAAISLFGPPGVKLPAWFQKHDWGVRIRYAMAHLFSHQEDLGLTKKDMGTYSINISSLERAIMEVLYLAPQQESLEEAILLMEGLTTLRPPLVQGLLERCRSVKVKRLFMFLAEECGHPWVKRLDLSKVDFGKGKRTIVKGGRFDPKYQITVPPSRSELKGYEERA